ncbi:MAG: tetratricopeptide repeat protein [Elusimicrobiota bacterium]|nr:tetratricopeptide repeat protein [Elusimicrobiota bacterium]
MSDRALTRLLVASASVSAFAPALFGGFAGWDDRALVLDNPALRGLDLAHLRAMATSLLGGVWIPLTWLSLALDRAVWGEGPGGFHLTNLLLHAVTALLFHEVCLVLFRRLGLRAPDRAATLAALFFAAHPLRVETVAWIAERKGVLSGALWTAALLARLRAHESPRPARWQAASVAAFALSLLAKPNGLTFTLVLLALEAGLLRRRPTVAGYAPYFALTAAAFGATWHAGRSAGVMGPSHPASLAWSAGQALYGLFFYPLMTLWPTGLSVYHPPRPWFGTWSWPLAAHAAALAAVLLGLRAAGERARPVAVALACYALALLPMLGLVSHGVAHAAAERFSYLPSMPLSALLGAGFAAGGRAALVVAAAALTAFGAASWRRCAAWDTPLALWTAAAEARPSAYSLANQGALLARDGRYEEAVPVLRASLALSDAESVPHEALGIALSRLGREAEARAAWRAGLAAAPSALLKTLLDSSLAVESHDLGLRALRAGRPAEAERRFREAVRADPGLGAARVNLGNTLARRGLLAEAAAQYRAVRKEDRASKEARSNLEQVEAALRRVR